MRGTECLQYDKVGGVLEQLLLFSRRCRTLEKLCTKLGATAEMVYMVTLCQQLAHITNQETHIHRQPPGQSTITLQHITNCSTLSVSSYLFLSFFPERIRRRQKQRMIRFFLSFLFHLPLLSFLYFSLSILIAPHTFLKIFYSFFSLPCWHRRHL